MQLEFHYENRALHCLDAGRGPFANGEFINRRKNYRDHPVFDPHAINQAGQDLQPFQCLPGCKQVESSCYPERLSLFADCCRQPADTSPSLENYQHGAVLPQELSQARAKTQASQPPFVGLHEPNPILPDNLAPV